MVRTTSWLTAGAFALAAVGVTAASARQDVQDPKVSPAGVQAADQAGQKDESDEGQRLDESIEVLQELTTAPEDQIPRYLLERAEAIVVIPSLVKGGFIVGAKHGKGVMAVRDRAAKSWSAPAFVKLTGGSIGWQIGLQSVDLVLLVMNEKGVKELLDDRFTLGGTASVAAGPVGRQAEAATNAQFSAEILAYSRAKGLFAGATLEGAALRSDDDSNEAFYGAKLELEDVVMRTPATLPSMASRWRTVLQRITNSDQ
jgi:lipid-binding SYLF domain-containing protein